MSISRRPVITFEQLKANGTWIHEHPIMKSYLESENQKPAQQEPAIPSNASAHTPQAGPQNPSSSPTQFNVHANFVPSSGEAVPKASNDFDVAPAGASSPTDAAVPTSPTGWSAQDELDRIAQKKRAVPTSPTGWSAQDELDRIAIKQQALSTATSVYQATSADEKSVRGSQDTGSRSETMTGKAPTSPSAYITKMKELQDKGIKPSADPQYIIDHLQPSALKQQNPKGTMKRAIKSLTSLPAPYKQTVNELEGQRPQTGVTAQEAMRMVYRELDSHFDGDVENDKSIEELLFAVWWITNAYYF